MRYVAAWRSVAGLEAGALFRAVGKGGRVGDAIDGSEVARIFKGTALAAGVGADEVAQISGHSSRVSAAQDMVRARR